MLQTYGRVHWVNLSGAVLSCEEASPSYNHMYSIMRIMPTQFSSPVRIKDKLQCVDFSFSLYLLHCTNDAVVPLLKSAMDHGSLSRERAVCAAWGLASTGGRCQRLIFTVEIDFMYQHLSLTQQRPS